VATLIRARYAGHCRDCGEEFGIGELVAWLGRGRGVRCRVCQPLTRDDQEYALGVADARRYQAEKAIFGERLADRFAAEDEFNRYWKNGEDY